MKVLDFYKIHGYDQCQLHISPPPPPVHFVIFSTLKKLLITQNVCAYSTNDRDHQLLSIILQQKRFPSFSQKKQFCLELLTSATADLFKKRVTIPKKTFVSVQNLLYPEVKRIFCQSQVECVGNYHVAAQILMLKRQQISLEKLE